MSLIHLQDMFSRRLQDMSSRRLQDQQMFAGIKQLPTQDLRLINTSVDAKLISSKH